MRKITIILLSVIFGMTLSAKTVEESALFEKHVDKETGVVSYILKPGTVKDNSQCLYFTQKSMTNDGRFILCFLSENEFRNDKASRKLYAIDLKKETVTCLCKRYYVTPYLDVERDVVYYTERSGRIKAIYKINLKDPEYKEIKICDVPAELSKRGKLSRICTSLTLSPDRTWMFCDSRIGDHYIQGRLNLKNGKYEYWGEAPFAIGHGQMNPKRNDLAIGAHEWQYRDSAGVQHIWKYEKGKCPRIQLFSKGKRDTVFVKTPNGKAYHECWSTRGEGIYYCGDGVFYYDLKTKQTTQVAPLGHHASMSTNLRYVVADHPQGSHFRGRPWKVSFYNRDTEKSIYIHSDIPAIATKEHPSNFHPDPHPAFNCKDKYIICTMNGEDGNMHLSVTPVKQLIEMTSK